MKPTISLKYPGFLKVFNAAFSEETMNGINPPPCKNMEFIERGDAVSVLILHKKNVIVLSQFRIGPFIRKGQKSSYSFVAGMIDKNETPEEAALREAFEEANLKPEDVDCIQFLGSFFSSSGGSTERIFHYVIEAKDSFDPQVNDKEIHKVLSIPPKMFKRKITEGRVNSMQTAMTFFLAEEHCYV